MDLNGECKGGDGFIDRSRVRILLCDNDSKSLGDAFTLLSQCSYQVTSVKSARQVIDALNAEGPDIDIILAEIDLPMAKGMKMLRYITRDKDLRRIPVIMMSRKDEVPVVVKCLKLGAADYLVKPLRTNELLNLWTHMWRRRRMLGLVEKNMLSYEFDLAGSDPSDHNTNSTNLFSDDTDDRSLRSNNPQRGALSHQENEWLTATPSAYAGVDGTATSAPDVAALESPVSQRLAASHHEPMKSNRQLSLAPKKSRLKIGESSAFFTYVKSTTDCQDPPHLHPSMAEKLQVVASEAINNHNKQARKSRETSKNRSQGENLQNGANNPVSLERSRTVPASTEGHMNTSMNRSKDVSGYAYPYYMQGAMNQAMMQSATMMPQYGHCPPPNHLNGITGFPYYHHPMNTSLHNGHHHMYLQNGHHHMSMVHHHHSWSGAVRNPNQSPNQSPNPPSNDASVKKLDRREEALLKFRRKRNQRCFDKKIRYVNRKRLAERRPRVKGQFVRKANGFNVDLNGQPDSDDEEEEDEEESPDSSPQDDAIGS